MVTKDVLIKWNLLAKNDLLAAKQLLDCENLLLSVFHLQQAVEKILKQYHMWKVNDQPPYIHNLTELSNKSGLFAELTEKQKDLLDSLNPFYIKTRYPTYKKQLEEHISKQQIQKIYLSTEEFIQWLEQKMK